jgi:hypothetical protein
MSEFFFAKIRRKKMIKNFGLAMCFASLMLMANIAATEKSMCTSLAKIPDHIYNGIPLTKEYEIKNGLLGMNRDINLRLVRKLSDKSTSDKSIIELFGISSEYFEWKDHPLFKVFRTYNMTDKICTSILVKEYPCLDNAAHKAECKCANLILGMMQPRHLVTKGSDQKNLLERKDISPKWVVFAFDNTWKMSKQNPVIFSNYVNVAMDSEKNTPLHCIVKSKELCSNDLINLFDRLLNNYSVTLAQNLEGNTAFHLLILSKECPFIAMIKLFRSIGSCNDALWKLNKNGENVCSLLFKIYNDDIENNMDINSISGFDDL